jgi:hypothetical protein
MNIISYSSRSFYSSNTLLYNKFKSCSLYFIIDLRHSGVVENNSNRSDIQTISGYLFTSAYDSLEPFSEHFEHSWIRAQ